MKVLKRNSMNFHTLGIDCILPIRRIYISALTSHELGNTVIYSTLACPVSQAKNIWHGMMLVGNKRCPDFLDC